MHRTGTRPEKNSTNALIAVPLRRLHTVIPGVVLSVAVASAGIALSEFLGTRVLGLETSPVSSVMTAILLGILISNAVRLPAMVKPGVTFSVAKLLRLGIVLLGARLSVADVLRLGAVGVPIVVGCIVGAIFLTSVLSRALKLPRKLGTLIAVGTSICGVSAIVATGAAIDGSDEEVAYAVSVITIFGLIATIVYPYLAHAIFIADHVKVGLFLGTAVHDTSQVTGAAVMYAQTFSGDDAINAAVVAKLFRNTLMAVVIPFMAYSHARRAGSAGGARRAIAKFFPIFILGFLAFVVARSIGDVTIRSTGSAFGVISAASWTVVLDLFGATAVGLLVVALAGVGLNTRIRDLKRLGIKPLVVGFAAAATVGALSFALILLLGRFVAFG